MTYLPISAVFFPASSNRLLSTVREFFIHLLYFPFGPFGRAGSLGLWSTTVEACLMFSCKEFQGVKKDIFMLKRIFFLCTLFHSADWVWVCIWYHFSLALKILVYHLLLGRSAGENSHISFIWNVIISSSFLKDIFNEYKIFVPVLLLSALYMFFCSPGLHCFWEEVNYHLHCSPLYIMCHFPLNTFKTLFSTFRSLATMCLGIFLCFLILLEIFLTLLCL